MFFAILREDSAGNERLMLWSSPFFGCRPARPGRRERLRSTTKIGGLRVTNNANLNNPNSLVVSTSLEIYAL